MRCPELLVLFICLFILDKAQHVTYGAMYMIYMK